MLLLAAAHGRDPKPRRVELCDEIADEVLVSGWNKRNRVATGWPERPLAPTYRPTSPGA
jgi:hypothetical protein